MGGVDLASPLTESILREIMDCFELSILRGRHYYTHFTDEEIETQGLCFVLQ